MESTWGFGVRLTRLGAPLRPRLRRGARAWARASSTRRRAAAAARTGASPAAAAATPRTGRDLAAGRPGRPGSRPRCAGAMHCVSTPWPAPLPCHALMPWPAPVMRRCHGVRLRRSHAMGPCHAMAPAEAKVCAEAMRWAEVMPYGPMPDRAPMPRLPPMEWPAPSAQAQHGLRRGHVACAKAAACADPMPYAEATWPAPPRGATIAPSSCRPCKPRPEPLQNRRHREPQIYLTHRLRRPRFVFEPSPGQSCGRGHCQIWTPSAQRSSKSPRRGSTTRR